MSKLKSCKAALVQALLEGKIINQRNVHVIAGVTNASREIIRQVEEPFHIKISRDHRKGKTRYGTPCQWFDYFLVENKLNREQVKAMRQYVNENKN